MLARGVPGVRPEPVRTVSLKEAEVPAPSEATVQVSAPVPPTAGLEQLQPPGSVALRKVVPVGRERRVSSKGQVIVLGLGGPVLSEIEFGAVAERPANTGVAWRAEACGNDTNSGIIC